jgi:hypothetical protein
MMQKKFETVGQDFGDDLVNDVAKANWSKMVDNRRTQLFGNKSNEGVVLFLKKMIFQEKISNTAKNNILSNTPIFFCRKGQ